MRERSATLGLAPILPGIVLVVVIVWALAAVLMLTATLVNAREIDDTLPLINKQVSPIDKDLDNVKLAAETNRIAARIRKRAAPLSAQADRILTEAGNIDKSAAEILKTAGAINETAGSINATAKAINGTAGSINDKVSSINANAVSINDTVGSIQGNAFAINRKAGSILGKATTINARVDSVFRRVGPPGARDSSIKAAVGRITRKFRLLSPETKAIDSGVAAINRRAIRGIRGVGSLKSDFGPISVLVGTGALGAAGNSTEGPGTIHGHANSIDCSALINFAGPTEYCGQ
jgi:methyl-accepting chemotaxis protein